MKKLYVILFLTIATAIPAAAQVNFKALDEAFSIILHKYPFQADSVAYCMTKKYKNEPSVYVGIARGYFENQANDIAEKYLAIAMHVDTTYAQSYILKGDMAIFAKDTTSAADWYKTAIKMDPHNADGYLKYSELMAERDPASAIAMLDSMKVGCPDYPADLAQASVLFSTGDFARASVKYDGIDKNMMNDNDLAKYAYSLYSLQTYDKSLDVVNYGLQHYPNSIPMNRMAFYNLARLNKYDESLKYGDKIMNALKGTGMASYLDIKIFGNVNLLKGVHSKAIGIFTDVLNGDTTYCSKLTNDNIKDAQNQVNKIILDVQDKGDFNSATALYQQFLSNKKRTGPYDEYTFTNIYRSKMDDALDANKNIKETYNQLDSVYRAFEDKYPQWNQMDVIYYYHAAYCTRVLDPNSTNGAAASIYTKLIKLDEAKQLTDNVKAFLKNAYTYLAFYNLTQEHTKRAKEYFRKLLIVDPENVDAKHILGIK